VIRPVIWYWSTVNICAVTHKVVLVIASVLTCSVCSQAILTD